ncbi:MAG: redox-regulated ATPase YchF [Planctomycetes bacterium]|nr:redox-regulated ATPase YchF [Planctomycetota bacterium]
MNLGIIGRPGCGKSTLFHALGGPPRPKVPQTPTDEKIVASIEVPDPRLEWLRDLEQPKKYTPARIEFIDLPGLPPKDVRGKAELLASMRDCDAFVMVARAFENDNYPYEGETAANPVADVKSLRDEFLLEDYAVLSKRVEKLRDGLKKPSKNREKEEHERHFLEKILADVEEHGMSVRDAVDKHWHPSVDASLLRSYAFLSQKPIVLVINIAEGRAGDAAVTEASKLNPTSLIINAEIEEEIASLEAADRTAFLKDFGISEPASARLIRASYAALGLRAFFTSGPDEVRAWTIKGGDDAVAAAGRIHSDLARGFIRAEVTAFDALKSAGTWREAKAKNLMRLEGKEYRVEDGDILNIRFAV